MNSVFLIHICRSRGSWQPAVRAEDPRLGEQPDGRPEERLQRIRLLCRQRRPDRGGHPAHPRYRHPCLSGRKYYKKYLISILNIHIFLRLSDKVLLMQQKNI